MSEHSTSMIQLGDIDAWMGYCSCGYQAGPDSAYAINHALRRHVRKAS